MFNAFLIGIARSFMESINRVLTLIFRIIKNNH